MMKRATIYIMMCLSMFSLQACTDWFDVGSKSEVNEDEMYDTAEGYYITLTGLYLQMGSTALYGGNLPLLALEPLTQQYAVSSDNTDRTAWMHFDYTTDGAQTMISNIWLTAYNTIVNANLLIAKLKEATVPGSFAVGPAVPAVLLGEALTLRAYLYLDLLRLFNPSFAVDATSNNVPFKTDFGFSLGEQLTTAQILDRLSTDLAEVRALLSADPLKTGQPTDNRYLSYDRRQRANYYAATALMARLEMMRGHHAEASAYAQEIIASGKYRFVTNADVLATDAYGVEQHIDRIFEPELIFALYSENILATSRSYYEGLTNDFVRSTNAYADGDIRTCWFFVNPSANGKINFVRYQRSTLAKDASKYGDPVVPMLKLSEMYLIDAECAMEQGDKSLALSQLNALRTARGETALAPTTTDDDFWHELTHEYICDFRGEGQLFLYYKRRNLTAIDDGNYGGNTVAVPTSAYTLPLPPYETQFGYAK